MEVLVLPLLTVLLVLVKSVGSDILFDCTEHGTDSEVYCSKPVPNLKTAKEGALGQFGLQARSSQTSTYTCSGTPPNFRCTSEGRFPDWSDPTCMWYFECEKLATGNFLEKYLRCPKSLFSPSIQKCTSSYECPCRNASDDTTTTAEPAITTLRPPWCAEPVTGTFICTDVGRFPDYRDVTCQKYFLCSKLHNGTYTKTPYTCRGSAFDPNIGRCNKMYACPCEDGSSSSSSATSIGSSSSTSSSSSVSSLTTDAHLCLPPSDEFPDFYCSEIGRFPDLTDLECQRYFLCSKLHNGSYIQTLYACPDTGFDPRIGKCSISYACPCFATATTTPLPSPSESQNNSSASTDPTLPTPPHPCSSTSSDLNFTCSEPGRFPDSGDSECRKYFLCSKLSDGTFVKTEYSCPDSRFDPGVGRCSADYECPCVVWSSSSESPTSTTAGPIVTITDIASSNTDPSTTTTDPTSTIEEGTTTTVSSKTSEEPAATTAYPCIASEGDSEAVCTAVGRFPDLTDQKCQKYFLCSKLRNGTFVRTDYSCPNSKFDPRIGKCNVTYECPCAISSHSPIISTDQETESTVGFSTGAASATVSLSSTESSTYSSSTGSSPSSALPPSSVSTPYPCIHSSGDDPEFTCAKVGRFPDLTDQKCQKYFLCSKLRNGTFVRTDYSCPNSKFDPRIGKCDVTYECPCNTPPVSLTTLTSTTTEESSISSSTEEDSSSSSSDDSSASDEEEGSSSSEKTTESSTAAVSQSSTAVESSSVSTSTSSPCLPPSKDGSEHTCSVTGRFPDLTDHNCQKYFLCSRLRNGTFIRTDYSCPESRFDPNLGKCNMQYKCPCVST